MPTSQTENDGQRQRHPIDRHNPAEPPSEVATEAHGSTDIVIMYKQDNEAANREK